MPLKSIPYILLLSFLFGSTLIASRFSTTQLHPTNYVGIRLMLASLGHIILYTFSTRFSLPKDLRIWRHGALIGIFDTAIPMTLLVTSLEYQSSGLTSILLTTGPAITVVFAHFFLPDEPLTWVKTGGVILALGGAVLLTILGESGLPDITTANHLGYALVFIAMISVSASAVYIRKYVKDDDSFDIASARMFAATLAVGIVAAFVVKFDLSQVNEQGYFAIGYAAVVGTFFGLLLRLYITQRFGATSSAMTSYFIPIVAAVGGALVLDEQITPGMISGMVLILIGITIINRDYIPENMPDIRG